jgi:hypothetical protein
MLCTSLVHAMARAACMAIHVQQPHHRAQGWACRVQQAMQPAYHQLTSPQALAGDISGPRLAGAVAGARGVAKGIVEGRVLPRRLEGLVVGSGLPHGLALAQSVLAASPHPPT